ncbi:MAG: class I SAM-dependent methyltransferase [Candidatus Sumerlaeia bacterium]|nr:class I SAM-dependent methyltransferase [Candidatus Sumerlaeia bacterium]
MPSSYDPKQYWQKRLSSNFDLRGVGYRRFSTSYNNWMYRLKREKLEEVLAGSDPRSMEVLDIGCGTGFFVRWYLERGARVLGVDITDVSVEKLRTEFPAAEFVVADVGDATFQAPRAFDIVNMWDVVYHIVDDERFRQAMANIAGATKPGGLFLLTDNFGDTEDRRAAEHVRKRCMATYEALLPEMGFKLEKLLPLFDRLNRPISRWDNLLARFYYGHDKRLAQPARDNLGLAVWCRQTAGS